MEARGSRQARMLLGLGALLAFLILLPASPAYSASHLASPVPKGDQKCINTVNQNAAKIVKAQGKVICDCIKDAAKGKVTAQLIGTIEACLTLDRKLKVKKAKDKLDDKITKDCGSYPEDPNGFAPVDLSDPNFIKARSMEKDLSLIHWIFGSDLDEVIVKEGDPNTPNAKNVSKCQQAAAKQAKKCQDTKLKVFLACKKDGMKGKTPPGQISSSEDLERLCLQSDPNDPTTPQPDPKGKIAKACDSKLASTIQKKCTDKGVDLSVAFALFDPNAGTLQDYIEVMVECEVCLYWNAIDGLDRNCDLFDDGLANGSCGAFCGDGAVNQPTEECDDGNNDDGDGCTSDCLIESCGDGVLQTGLGEECDDGNMASGDGCSSDCLIEFCGDGIINDAPNEQCDDGIANSDVVADACRTDCTLARCGDGVTDAGEECDDNNNDDGDGCTADCLIEIACGATFAQCNGLCPGPNDVCRNTGSECGCLPAHATCVDIVTTMNVWGNPANGVDLRAWTASTLHFIGCVGLGCLTTEFFCNDGIETLTFGSSSTNVLRAVVDPNNAFGDTMPTGFTGCCSVAAPLDVCDAPDSNNNGVAVDNAAALCNALGYQNGMVINGVGSSLCPEAHVLSPDGQDWTTDFVGSAGHGKQFECSVFK